MRKWDERRGYNDGEIEDKIEEQGGVCAKCGKPLSSANAQGHSLSNASRGGPTQPYNLEALDKECHAEETENERGDGYGKKGRFGYDDEKRGTNLVKRFFKRKPKY
jgi:hypothetical protein